MKEILHKLKEKREIVDIIFLISITILLSSCLFKFNTDIYLDDGSQHLLRAYGTYKSIKQNGTGIIISEFVNGFGYCWNLFYGPFSAYALMFFGIIFGSFNFGFKILFTLIMFFAGLAMYKFVKEMTENKSAALLAGILYITSPYFFTDIYIRHALGEAISFIFVPLVFWGLYNIFNTEKNHYHLIFGAVGLIISHNISTLLTMIFAFVYCVINIKNIFTNKVKKGLVIDFIFILLLTSFFWIPFIQTKMSTNYRVFEHDAMSSQESILSHTKTLKELFTTPNDSIFIFEIGLPIILMLMFSVMTLKKLEENKKEYLFFLIAGIISTFMVTKYFPWKLMPKFMYIIQFPWRLLMFASFFFSIICSINMENVIRRFNIKDVLIIALICIIYLFSKYYVVQYNENIENVENYEINLVSGQDNEWLPGMGRLEYLPTKAYDNTFYIATRSSGIIQLKGECEIKDEMKIGTYMTAKIKTQDDDVLLEIPYIYYPGYTIRLDGMILNTLETENGFVGCMIPANEEGILEIKYTKTNLMNFSQIISIISLIVFMIYVYKKY